MKQTLQNYFLTAALSLTICSSCSSTSKVRVDGMDVVQQGYTLANVSVRGVTSVILTGGAEEVLDNSTISLDSDDARLMLQNIDRQEWQSSDLCSKVFIAGEPLNIGINAQLVNYYNGLCVKPIVGDNYSPAVIYNATGESFATELGTIYIADEIPTGDDKMVSMMLKRGHMAVVSENPDGTGASRVYIASSKCMDISLESDLHERVSFMRIQPWSYVAKRGMGGGYDERHNDLNITWFYNWGIKRESTPEIDFAPMFWSQSSEAGINKVVAQKMTNHILSFNEPDGDDQANLSPEEAANRYPELLKCGLRIGSPACREGHWNSWLSDFMEICKERKYRVDFIATHWYDWGDWGKTNDPTPEDVDSIVQRFKRDIDRCYAKYGLPIWITEFNANKNRLTNIQIEFLKRAIPMLEAHPHVERYAYFQPFGGNGDFFKDGKLTQTAKAYSSYPSTPSIPESTL